MVRIDHMIGALHGPWLICAALLHVAEVLRRAPRPPLGEARWVVCIVMGAAVARLVWGVWGPMHPNGQGPAWIRGALDPLALAGYGPGYFELFGWVTRLGVAPDRAVFIANALLSALSPALLYAAARLLGVGRGGSLAAAMVLAADAVSVRSAASEAYFASLIALVLAVQVSLALAVQADLRRDRLACVLALVAAGVLAAAAARIHPLGYLPLALSPLVVLGAAQPEDWRRRVLHATVAAAAIGAAVLVSSGNTVIAALRSSSLTPHAFTSLAGRDVGLLLLLLATVWCLRRWIEPPFLPVLGIVALAMLLATQDSFQQLWKLCYQRVFWPCVLLGAAPLLPRRMQGTGWALASSAVVAAALLVPALPYLSIRTTEQLEYRFLQETLPSMPPGCMLGSVSHAGRRLWEIPNYLIPARGSEGTPYRNFAGESDLHDAVGSAGCLVYVRASLCTSAEARALCESFEQEPRLEPVARRVFPPLPTFEDLPYDRPEVEVVVFRATNQGLAGGSAALGDGAPITAAFTQALYDRLIVLRESDGCHVERLDTSRFRMTAAVQTASGEEHPVQLASTSRRSEGTRRAGDWAMAASTELERNCGETLAAMERVLKDIGAPGSVGSMQPTD